MSDNSQGGSLSGRVLELSSDEMRSLVDQAMQRIMEHLESLADGPAHDLEDAEKLAMSLIESTAPEKGQDLVAILDHLFDVVVPKSITTPGPGFMAYIPGGGIFHAAVADLIADSVNRYVGAWGPAPGLARIEANVVEWLANIIGMKKGSGGFLTTGGSLANFSAVVAARHSVLGEEIASGVIYVSDQGHHSVVKAGRMAGFRAAHIRSVPSDEFFRIDVSALAAMIAADTKTGLRPALIVGSAGTTNTGAVDDLEALADVARTFGLWYHIDAAYGGFFMLTERGRASLRGIEQADSVTLDPHKGMFLPYGTGALIVKDVSKLRDAHSVPAEYMPTPQNNPDLVDFCEISPELSRDMRALRIWLPVKMHGLATFRANLDEKLDLIAVATEELKKIPCVEIIAEPQLTVVAFRLVVGGSKRNRINGINKRFLDLVNGKKRVYLSGTVLSGEFVLRICILSFRTHRDRLEQGLEDIRAAAAEALKGGWRGEAGVVTGVSN